MTCELVALAFDARDPAGLAAFWGGLLRREPAEDHHHGGVALLPDDERGFRLSFVPSDQLKLELNRVHLDLTSASWEEQEATVARAVELGGRLFDVGQLPEEEHVVLADPEDNEFCVIEPGNGFLAGCGFIGALSSDGSAEVGYFWSKALGWPLVWDQDQETAVQAAYGGPKISWGGPPLRPRTGKNRVHLDVAPAEGVDRAAEVERLLSLGATPADVDLGEVDGVVLADPDGNEFCVLPPR